MDVLRALFAFIGQLFRKAPTTPAPRTPAARTQPGIQHHVRASSFADPADVAAFRRCKARGGSDQECFKVGDNGIGYFGDDTTGEIPMCALPPEDMEERWGTMGAASHKKVFVSANGRDVVCILADRMPRREHIGNSAGIDLNPAACAALNLRPPVLHPAIWSWV